MVSSLESSVFQRKTGQGLTDVLTNPVSGIRKCWEGTALSDSLGILLSERGLGPQRTPGLVDSSSKYSPEPMAGALDSLKEAQTLLKDTAPPEETQDLSIPRKVVPKDGHQDPDQSQCPRASSSLCSKAYM